MNTAINFPHLGIYLDHVGKSISVFGFDIAYYGITMGLSILLGLYLPGGIDPLGQVDNHHSHQDDHCYHKQVIEP